jgi:hypothetical protein
LNVQPRVTLALDGDGCWPDLASKRVIDAGHSLGLALLREGTACGKESVTLRIDLPDGTVALAQITLRMLATATQALLAAAEQPE